MVDFSKDQQQTLLRILESRFEGNMHRHRDLLWLPVSEKLMLNPGKLWSLHEMERTGGEPDVVGYDAEKQIYVFMDCAAESPAGRRSLCYDPAALASRKEHKPAHSAAGMASEMGIELLTEAQYAYLQHFGKFDTKTSSWLKTPDSIRGLGGALFGDWRYGHVFTYHNGAESYYSSRGFRGCLKV